jgi:hypothetical protein
VTFKEIIAGCRGDFWLRLSLMEDHLRAVAPFIPIEPRSASPLRLRLRWTGRDIEAMQYLELPVPTLAELHAAMDDLEHVIEAAGVLLEGRITPAPAAAPVLPPEAARPESVDGGELPPPPEAPPP